ncbi:hypothetical protein HPB52_006180 [Rhipicephalus sanguineus]|uniref:Uncharacterized protein n=1 Tax=Rhipicephalus sanguineus TaxID=34632 RepID=A0A9D4QGZ2_RHISA|nr:hypothetical protein HPB52_006180 [Rhipicephalus sanguineus]
MQASGLQYPLPPNLHLLTLEPVGGNRAIVRLEHLYPGVKDNRLNKPASVSLKNMLVPYTVTSAEENRAVGARVLAQHDQVPLRDEGLRDGVIQPNPAAPSGGASERHSRHWRLFPHNDVVAHRRPAFHGDGESGRDPDVSGDARTQELRLTD